MTWPLSFLVALINAILAGGGAMAVASLGVSWYRVTTREGAAGFFVIGMALLGAIAGAILGLIVARIVAASPEATFLRSMGYTAATTTGILLFITAISWLNADFAPKHEGQYLEVEVEFLCPPKWGKPEPKRGANSYVTLTADSGSRRQSIGMLEVDKGEMVDGRWKLRSFVSLQTSCAGKTLGVGINEDLQYIRPNIPARPTEKDFGWSPWIDTPTTANLTPVAPEDACSIRYRVGYSTSEAREAIRQQELDAKQRAEQDAFEKLSLTAPLAAWLPYVEYREDYTRRTRAIENIIARPNYIAELIEALRSSDHETVGRALLVLDGMNPPPAEFGPVVAQLGEQIVLEIEDVKKHLGEEGIYERTQDLAGYFGQWATAACALHEKTGFNLKPVVEKMEAAATHDSYVLTGIHGSISAYVGRWGGPTSPVPAATP